MEIMNIILEL